eukprot:gene6912-14039_t
MIAKCKLVSTIHKGRCVTAGQIIHAGTEILSEQPLATAPFRDIACNENSSFPNELSKKETFVLRNCPPHLSFQGTVLVSRVIKCMEMNDNTRNEVLKLHHNDKFMNNNDIDNTFAASQIINKLLDKPYEFQFCLEIAQRLRQNAFTITDEEMNAQGIGLYLIASMFNHSCVANAHHSFNGTTLTVRALRDISPGEEVTISYIDVGRPVWWRRSKLLSSYGFTCHCSRCSTRDTNEYYHCLDTTCVGKCVPSSQCAVILYRRWLHGTHIHTDNDTDNDNNLLLPLSDVSNVFPLPLPFGDMFAPASLSPGHVPVGNSSSTSSRNKSRVQHHHRHTVPDPDLIFECLRCHKTRSGEEMAYQMIAICKKYQQWKKRSQSQSGSASQRVDKSSDDLLALYTSTSSFIPTSSYCMMDMGSQLVLAMISEEKFSVAARILQESVLRSFYLSYPRNSPTIAIQELQLAKLLCYTGDNVMSMKRSLHLAMTILRHSHGEKHPLYTHVIEILNTTT